MRTAARSFLCEMAVAFRIVFSLSVKKSTHLLADVNVESTSLIAQQRSDWLSREVKVMTDGKSKPVSVTELFHLDDEV